MKKFISVSPLTLLEKSSRKVLGSGNLGALIARAGVGKTACLIHIALDRIINGAKLVHISLDEPPDKITSYYDVILHDLVKTLEIQDECEVRDLIDRNRLILAYLNQSFSMKRLADNLSNLRENMGFIPDALIVDGLDFQASSRTILEKFKEIAGSFETEVWLSALSHRHITETNERGIPHPCHDVDDLFSIIMQMQPEGSEIHLRLLKDHDHPTLTGVRVSLDPGTFLVMN
jgi:KaiC/GvpD/RAD55 family RecA-like ATPase